MVEPSVGVTLCPASFTTTCAPRSRSASTPSGEVIEEPFGNTMASARMLTPSVSSSPARTS